MAIAISEEINLTTFPNSGLNTLYFGGGTPSLLELIDLEKIIGSLKNKTDFFQIKEITLECNPEDVNEESLKNWHKLGISRLSIGLQSLQDNELKAMNRCHSASDSWACLEAIKKYGHFEVSVDLIYGTPWKSNIEWEQELDKIIGHPAVKHLSAYALTIEQKTKLYHQIQKGDVKAAPDEKMVEQFYILQNKIKHFQWDAYEISNYCAPNHRAEHNSQYWKYSPYFGVGPAAHSYDGHNKRYVNIANNAKYIKALSQKELPRTYEYLSEIDQLNERLMTGLRTKEGIKTHQLLLLKASWETENHRLIQQYLNQGFLIQTHEGFALSENGKLISDQIISNLMVIN